MFELAAGNLNQELRDREIEDGLRRRQLLASASAAASASAPTAGAARNGQDKAASPGRIDARRGATAQR